MADPLWTEGVPKSEVFGSRRRSTQHRGAWKRKFRVWEVLDFSLSSYLLQMYLPGPVVFLDPGGMPCMSCPPSLVQVAGSIPFRGPQSLGFLGPDHTQASPRVLLWDQNLYVIQGWGSLCLSPIFLPFIPWQGCRSGHSMTGLGRVWRAWLWCVYYVGIHISFQWLVTLPRCL